MFCLPTTTNKTCDYLTYENLKNNLEFLKKFEFN